MGEKVSKLSSSHVKQEDIPRENSKLRTIPDCLRYYASQEPEKEAVILASTDGSRDVVTFTKLYENSQKVALSLVRLGVKPRDVVAVNVRTCREWLFMVFGSIMAGAIPFAVSFTYKDGSDLIAIMDRLKVCSCMFLDPGYGSENWSILSKLIHSFSANGYVSSARMPSLRYLICHDPSKSVPGVKLFEQLLKTEAVTDELPEVKEGDIAMLFQTSGSTGLPKAVAHTHRSLLDFTKFASGHAFSRNDRYFCDRPFGWIGGFPLNCLIGQTRVTVSGFFQPPKNRPEFLLEVILREKCTVVLGLPTVIHELLERKGEIKGNLPIKTIITGGQPITKQTLASLGQLCKYMMILYGTSEFVLASALIISDADKFVDFSAGPVAPGLEVKVVDSDLKIVPVGTSGEIYVRCKSLFKEYFNDPERTKKVLTDNGWFRTDDLGRMLEDGSLVVEGRKSNMILSGGMNVVPEILENLISRCPGVDSVVLVPVPDEVMYQMVCACVKILPGSDVNERAVRKFCEDAHGDTLGLFTVLPKFYMLLDAFPETSTGKVSRKALSAMACETFNK